MIRRASSIDEGVIEQKLARHFAATSRSELPSDAVEQAVRAILWWTATALEGSRDDEQGRLIHSATRAGGAPEATVVGGGQRVPAEIAGLVNGRAGKAFEHEDKYWADESIGLGIGCCVVPAAVAMAQARGGVSGSELITAVAIGIDFVARLARPLGMAFIPGRATANATFVLGNYGAAIAAAKVARLDAASFQDALGLAHGQAAGNFQGQYEGRGVATQCGFAVRNGITAARLAALGMSGSHNAISGRAGIYAVHYPHADIDSSLITAGLGREYLGANLGFKAYPCGIVAHPALDAIRDLRRDLDLSTVNAIDIIGPLSLSIMAQPLEVKQAPRSAIEAQFSIPWAVACVLRDGELNIDHYSEECLTDDELRRLAGVVTIQLESGKHGTSVLLKLKDCSVKEAPTVVIARGHPSNPLGTDKISSLFLRAAECAEVSSVDSERMLASILHLDAERDVDLTMSFLGGARPR